MARSGIGSGVALRSVLPVILRWEIKAGQMRYESIWRGADKPPFRCSRVYRFRHGPGVGS